MSISNYLSISETKSSSLNKIVKVSSSVSRVKIHVGKSCARLNEFCCS